MMITTVIDRVNSRTKLIISSRGGLSAWKAIVLCYTKEIGPSSVNGDK